MGFKRQHSITLLFFVLVLLILGSRHWKIQEQFYLIYYYLTQSTEKVDSKTELREVLNSYEQIEFKDLSKEYKEYTKSNNPKYASLLSNKKYLVLRRKDFFKQLLGPFRIRDFIAKDKYYKSCIRDGSADYYWLISEKLILKLHELRDALEREGYNPNGFSITNGHRHPSYNENVGGASKSRHIQGEAIDLHIGDINNSGKYEKEDKEIVLGLLDEEIIGATGGIGRYPGTRAVHFDVRGYRARWDKQ